MRSCGSRTAHRFVLIFIFAVAGCMPRGISAQTADSAVQQVATVTISPKLAAVTTTTQTQQFKASPTTVTWTVDGIAGGNTTVGTISTTGLYTPPATAGTHTIKATSGTASASATIAVSDLAAVLTYHNDPSRDGANVKEYALTPTTVATTTFGKLFGCGVDGALYGQPLWIKGLTIGGGVHNVIFAATENDTVYAFDADTNPCVTYWHVNLLDTLHGGAAGEKPIAWNDVGGCGGNIYPQVGVTSTPVIATSTNTIYLVSASEMNVTNPGNCVSTSGTFLHKLHALDLITGSEKFNAPVTITAAVPGTGDASVNGMVGFDSQFENQRAGLASDGGKIFVGFASHEDAKPFHGWLFGYSAANVQDQVALFNTTPNGIGGADGGIWAGGAAPPVDAGGDVYVAVANGVFDESPTPSENDYGDSVLRLHSITGTTPNGKNLSVADYFTPFNESNLAEEDADLGSGGPVLLPTQTTKGLPANLLVQIGKQALVYLINRDSMGGYNASSNQVVQSFTTPSGVFGSPAFWHNNLYIGGPRDGLRQYVFDPAKGQFNTPAASVSSQVFSWPGTTPSISSNGATNGIVWTLDESLYGYGTHNAGIDCSVVPLPAACAGPAILHAYDATNLAVEYWNSTMAANNRDKAGNAVKFVPPTIANGKVYVATRSGIIVYGLLPN
jgi:hypothetical protein